MEIDTREFIAAKLEEFECETIDSVSELAIDQCLFVLSNMKDYYADEFRLRVLEDGFIAVELSRFDSQSMRNRSYCFIQCRKPITGFTLGAYYQCNKQVEITAENMPEFLKQVSKARETN